MERLHTFDAYNTQMSFTKNMLIRGNFQMTEIHRNAINNATKARLQEYFFSYSQLKL